MPSSDLKNALLRTFDTVSVSCGLVLCATQMKRVRRAILATRHIANLASTPAKPLMVGGAKNSFGQCRMTTSDRTNVVGVHRMSATSYPPSAMLWEKRVMKLFSEAYAGAMATRIGIDFSIQSSI